MSTSKRESYPPRTSSLGRLPLPNSRSEPLAAHPLLNDTTPRYVPYTPRQRVGPPSAATTASQVHATAGPSPSSGPARVDLGNLRIAAQALGVGQGCTGWAILERLVGLGVGEGVGEEWAEVWSSVVNGKTTLLLPLDSTPKTAPLTPEFLKDHIVLSDSASFTVNGGGVVMLSGMRGLVCLDDVGKPPSNPQTPNRKTRLKFRSSITPSSKLFRALLDPLTRTQGLGRLAPLDSGVDLVGSTSEVESGGGGYPMYELGSYTNSLPLPVSVPSSSSLNTNTNTTTHTNTNPPILKPPLPPLPPRPGPSPLVHSHTLPNQMDEQANGRDTLNLSSGSLSVPVPIPVPAGGGAGGASRLSSGFASLFGVRASTPPLVRTPPPPPPPSATTAGAGADGMLEGDVGLRTPPSSTTAMSSPSPQTPPSSTYSPATPPPPTQPQTQTQTIEIQVYTIPHSIIRDEVGEKVRLGIEREVCDALGAYTGLDGERGGRVGERHGKGGWVAERVMEFIKDLMPFVKVERSDKGAGIGIGSSKSAGMGMTLVAGKGAAGRRGGERDPSAGISGRAAGGGGGAEMKYTIPAFNERIEDLSERFQAFYERLEGDLYAFFDVDSNSKLGGGGKAGNEGEGEVKVREVMEVVERVVCELFYDRLYLQPTSDDPTHDEALSSRVAALNMLDLGLEHLDVDVSSVGGEGVDAVVKACGETLTQLDVGNARSPADKAAIIVAAHKVVVDGLSKLPPVRLKSEATPANQKAHKPLLTEKDLPLLLTHSPLPSGPIEAVDAPAVASPTTLISTPSSDVPTVLVSDPHATLVDSPNQASSTPSSISLDAPPSQTAPPPPPPPPISTTSTTTVSGDILLPLIIFSVVKANPPHLVSHLLYTQRFRNQRVGGEENYCMINLMAVAEFLENVDLGALGLGDSEKKVISTADLTPIPLVRTPDSPAFPRMPSLRGRVEQQVDAIAGSANKVISGVVDTSFGMLRSFLPLPGSTPSAPADGNSQAEVPPSIPWNAVRPGFGLLRRESGFSIASLAASLPGSKDRAKSILGDGEEAGQQLVSVNSRPGSVKSGPLDEDEGTSDEDGESGDDTGGEEDEDEMEAGIGHDTRSIKSFESMMSGSAKERKEAHARKSLSDRLAHMPGLSRVSQSGAHKGSPPASIRSSSLIPPTLTNRFDTPSSSRPQSPLSLRLAPPNRRFVECHEDDLKVSEVPELLREYKRLVEGVRANGGFDE